MNEPRQSRLTMVTARTLVMFADNDLINLQRAVEMFQALPKAELAIVSGTSRFLTQEKPASTGIRRPPQNRPCELFD